MQKSFVYVTLILVAMTLNSSQAYAIRISTTTPATLAKATGQGLLIESALGAREAFLVYGDVTGSGAAGLAVTTSPWKEEERELPVSF